ncbi:hypothetical protein KNSL1_009749 [Colletotrichum chrysophilum]|nr:hypothetical protein KNSL1_009749 [Colletotrichum chrysophilum]
MGKSKSVKFAKDMERMKYSALEEADADDELDSLDGMELEGRDGHGHSPTFPDEWNHDRMLWDQRLRRVQKIVWVEGVIIAMLFGLVVFLGLQLVWPKERGVPLGVDPSGFVPPGTATDSLDEFRHVQFANWRMEQKSDSL